MRPGRGAAARRGAAQNRITPPQGAFGRHSGKAGGACLENTESVSETTDLVIGAGVVGISAQGPLRTGLRPRCSPTE